MEEAKILIRGFEGEKVRSGFPYRKYLGFLAASLPLLTLILFIQLL